MATNAQTVIWSDDFNDQDITDWTLVDADGDGLNWAAVQIIDEEEEPVGTPMLRSASWNSVLGPLTPNNWIISPAVDLSNYPAGSTVNLNWFVKASDADWDAEKYSVYVSTSNDPTVMVTSAISMTETTLDGFNELSARTLNIGALAGEAVVYIAFRHYDSSDMFTMEIDDVSVTGTALSTEDFFRNNLTMYPNPVNDVLNIDAKSGVINNITVTEINGRTVKNIDANGLSTSRVNTGDLTSGVYFVTVQTAEGKGTSKFIKN
ncbi:MAG: choice-of-anchor J domain-containing protein [Flavobacterium sp.]|nr:choice-of-anchor J domain-containing protein [Flavobacterium sp.]